MAPASKEPENPSLSTAGQEALNEQECSGAMTAGETTLSVGTKRRRVEHAQSTLTRPFKSPLKTSSLHATSSVKDDSQLSQNQKRGRYDGQGVEGSGNTNDPPIEKGNRRMKPNQNPIAITPDKKRVSSPGFVTHSISSSPLLAPSLARRVAGVHRGTSSNTSTSSQQSLSPMRRLLSPMKQPPYLATNPRLVTLQRQHSNILRSLSSARNTLNLLQQATRIEKQKQDEQLKDLTNHWRQVAQRAAEEVFTGAKERIDRMGGVKAWREMSTGKNNPGWGWDVDVMESKVWAGEGDGESDVDAEGEKEKRMAEIEDEFEKELDADGEIFNDVQEEEEGEEEELTMDMMLTILNVDLKIIGYDKETQKWK